MNHQFRHWVAGIVAMLILAACVTEPSNPVSLEEKLASRGFVIDHQVKRVREHQINGWSNLDRFAVIINVNASQHYLVTVRTSCDDGLRSARNLAFSTTIGDLTDKDKLVIRGSGRYTVQCFIDTIHLLKKIQ